MYWRPADWTNPNLEATVAENLAFEDGADQLFEAVAWTQGKSVDVLAAQLELLEGLK